MTRMVYIAGVCAILAAGVVLVSCVRQWRVVDPQVAVLLAAPGAVEVYAGRSREKGGIADGQVSSLVVQAQALATYLDPPVPPTPAEPLSTPPPKDRLVAKTVSPLLRSERKDVALVVQPKSSSLRFSVRATSYYADRAEKSMALIAEPGGKAGSERWVREGQMLGHFVVHEIRQGAVVFRQGQDLREVAVERSQGPKDLVTAVHSPPMREIGDTKTEKPRLREPSSVKVRRKTVQMLDFRRIDAFWGPFCQVS